MKAIDLRKCNNKKLVVNGVYKSLLFLVIVVMFFMFSFQESKSDTLAAVLYLFCGICSTSVFVKYCLFTLSVITKRYDAYCVDITKVRKVSIFTWRAYFDDSDYVPVNMMMVDKIENEGKLLIISFYNFREAYIYSKYTERN